ncbi:MAG: inositol monophosphatase, partial [Rhodobacteraceae bacterium]|nr:inositol monophosphatase [Paracoccaceae bacterium]
GRYDGYWEREINAWDMAAGLVIVREAGGFCEAVREGRDILESGSVLAANAEIFAAFAGVLRAPE